MTTVNDLQRRLNRLITHIDAQLPSPIEKAVIFDYSLFPDHEQEQLRCFLASLPNDDTVPLFMANLTDAQLYHLELWLSLEKALLNGDEAEATRQRAMLNTSDEALTQAFLSLDLSVLPASNAPSVQVDHCIYSFSPVGYRYITQEIARHGDIGHRRRDIWRWVHFFRENYGLE